MCSICNSNPCSTQCPNYEYTTSSICPICKEPILDGEEYIENDYGELRHYECYTGINDLLKWLGYEIRTMGDDDY